jgi:hypothetical protein
MVVTAHYITNDWKMRHVMLASVCVLYPHTGKRLAEHLLAAVGDMSQALLSSLWTITADNASSNTSMCDMLEVLVHTSIEEVMAQSMDEAADESSSAMIAGRLDSTELFLLPCLAHTLQLAVKQGLKDCESMDVAICTLRVLLKKISDSPKLLDALQLISSNLKMEILLQSLYVETRWNSTWQMVSGIINMRKPLEELQRRIRERHDGLTNFSITPTDRVARAIPDESWSCMQDFSTFLDAFKDATVLM